MYVAPFSSFFLVFKILSGPTRETVSSLFYIFYCEQKLHQVISTKFSSYHRLQVPFSFLCQQEREDTWNEQEDV